VQLQVLKLLSFGKLCHRELEKRQVPVRQFGGMVLIYSSAGSSIRTTSPSQSCVAIHRSTVQLDRKHLLPKALFLVRYVCGKSIGVRGTALFALSLAGTLLDHLLYDDEMINSRATARLPERSGRSDPCMPFLCYSYFFYVCES
jgi:hypothetical protein